MAYDYNLASCNTLDNSPAQLLGNESAKTNQSSVESIRDGKSRGSVAQKWPSHIALPSDDLRLPMDSAIYMSSQLTERQPTQAGFHNLCLLDCQENLEVGQVTGNRINSRISRHTKCVRHQTNRSVHDQSSRIQH